MQKADRKMDKLEWVVKCFNELAGWGYLSVEGSTVMLRESIVRNVLFVAGYLEGLLAVKLKSQSICSWNQCFSGQIETHETSLD